MLEHAFGTAESGDDLYFVFCLLQVGEKLSDFRRCLDQFLNKVVERGCLPELVIIDKRAQVAAALSKPAQVMPGSTEKTSPNAEASERCADGELTEVMRLQHKVSKSLAAVSAVNMSKPDASSAQRSSKGLDDCLCYCCGENVHFAVNARIQKTKLNLSKLRNCERTTSYLLLPQLVE